METPTPTIEHLLAERDWLTRIARRFSRDANLVEDLCQETWVRALERPPRERGNPRHWLGAVLRNNARQHVRGLERRTRRERSLSQPELLPSTLDVVSRTSLLRDLSHAVLQLDEPYRTTVLLRYFEDLPERDVARRMDVPASTVSTRLARALERLRRRFASRPEDRARLAAVAPLFGGARRATASLPVGLTAALVLVVATAVGVTSMLRSDGALPLTSDVGVSPRAGDLAPAVVSLPVREAALAADVGPDEEDAAGGAPANDSIPVQDEVLLEVLETAREVAATAPAPWPGFAFESIPIAVFRRGGDTYLVHHPDPPEGFVRVETARLSTELRVGPTTDAMRANTAGRLGGSVCAFIQADSLSPDGPHPGDVALVLHESAHAFQARAPAGGSARWPREDAALVASYPVLDAPNNAWGRIEGRLLADALEAPADAARARTLDALAVRAHRRGLLTSDALRAFERNLELNEGLPDYVARRMLIESGWAPEAFAEALPDRLRRVNVGGQGAARQRFYSTGAAAAFLLDRFAPAWQERVERRGEAADSILVDALGGDLEGRVERIAREHGFEVLLAEEAGIVDAIDAQRRRELTSVLSVPGRLLVLALGPAGAEVVSFDPMNLTAIDDALTLHSRIVTLALEEGEADYRAPVLVDELLHVAVAPWPDDAILERDGQDVTLGPDGALEPGHVAIESERLSVSCGSADVTWTDELVVVRPAPPAGPADLDAIAKRVARLREMAEAPIRAPNVALTDPAGRSFHLHDRRGHETTIVFFSGAAWATPSHRFVAELLTALEESGARPVAPGRLTLVATQCTVAEAARVIPPERAAVRPDPDRLLMRMFGVRQVPTAVHVSEDGVLLGSQTGARPDVLRDLLERLETR